MSFKFLLLCFLPSPSVCPSVCPCPRGDSGMVMHSVCINCGLTSTDDSEEDLKESRVRKPGLRDCGAALLSFAGGLLSAPILGNGSQPLAPLCSLCPLLPTRAPVSAHPPCPDKAGAVSDVSHTTQGCQRLTPIVILGTSQCRNENGFHGYLNLSVSFC